MLPVVVAIHATMEPRRVEYRRYEEVVTVGCSALHCGVAGGLGVILVSATVVAQMRDVFLEELLLALPPL